MPASGTFGHAFPADPPDTLVPTWEAFENYEDVWNGDDDAGGMVRGYGGDPGQKVQVRVLYKLAIITPILSRIVPWININGSAIMTNEQFGSTGVQSNAVLPPPLPSLPPLSDPIPTD